MSHSTYIHWLQLLGPEDLPAFRRFLHSPDHVAKRLPIALFDYLIRYEPSWRNDLTPPELEEKAIYHHLYPGEPHKPQRLRRVSMELRQLIEKFASEAQSPILRAELDSGLRVMQFMLHRNSPLFLEQAASFEAKLEALPMADDLPLARMQLGWLRNEYHLHRQSSQDMLGDILIHLDRYYLIQKLAIWTSMRSKELSHTATHYYPNYEAVMALAATHLNDPQVALWYSLFALMADVHDPVLLQQAQASLAQVGQHIVKQQLRQARGYIFNALISNLDQDDPAHYQRLFEFLVEMRQEGTLHLPDGRMSQPFFLAFVRSATLAGQALAALEFVQAESPSLATDDPDGVLGYAQALVHFHLGNHESAWKLAIGLKPNSVRIEIYLRILQVKIAYTLSEEDQFFRHTDSLRKFLRRHQHLGHRIQLHTTAFAQFAEALGRARFGHTARTPHLRSIQTKPTAERHWLLKELQALTPPRT